MVVAGTRDTPSTRAYVITACNATSIRRRGAGSEGKNDSGLSLYPGAMSSHGRALLHAAYSRTWTHRALPMPVMLRLIEQRTRRAWQNDTTRATAVDTMTRLLSASPRADEIDALARAHLFEAFKLLEMRWRPWLTTRQRVERSERLVALVGSGAVLSFVHQGAFMGFCASINRLGIPLSMLVDPMLLEADAAPIWKRHVATVTMGGTHVVPAIDSFATAARLLGAGHTVAIALDVAGSTDVSLLGHSVGLKSGTARLSLSTGVPVVPVTAHRWGRTQFLRVENPIYPDRFGSDHRALLAEVTRIHEPSILAWPEAIERPGQLSSTVA